VRGRRHLLHLVHYLSHWTTLCRYNNSCTNIWHKALSVGDNRNKVRICFKSPTNPSFGNKQPRKHNIKSNETHISTWRQTKSHIITEFNRLVLAFWSVTQTYFVAILRNTVMNKFIYRGLTILWNVMPYTVWAECYWCFGENCCFHLHSYATLHGSISMRTSNLKKCLFFFHIYLFYSHILAHVTALSTIWIIQHQMVGWSANNKPEL
jgi:hypothetical protein